MKEIMTDGVDMAALSKKSIAYGLDERSEQAQEIISHRPNFLERWSLLIFFGILVLLLSATWLIKYPDVIETRAILTTDNAPKEIITRSEGRLARLFVHNNQLVARNEVLGWLETTADPTEVLALSRQLDSSYILLNEGRLTQVSGLFHHNYMNLGETQQGYQEFVTALQAFNDYMVNGFYSNKRRLLLNDIKTLVNTRGTIQSQRELTERDMKLAEQSYKMNKTLVEQKVISPEEFRTEESKFFNKQKTIPQLDAALFENESQEREKRGEVNQLEHDSAQQQLTFREALQSLRSLVDEWKRKYVLQAPLDGTVYFTVAIQENQFLAQDKVVGYVSPNDNHFYAQTNLPQSNFGKVDTGLSVQLRFDAYPYEEYGAVEGTISYVSAVPSDSGFLAVIRLDRGLKTNGNRTIPFKSNLEAQAMVVTKNMRLLQRFYYSTVKSVSVGK